MLNSLRMGGVATVVAAIGAAMIAAPALAQDASTGPPATPQAECGPGSNPETGLQGRVSRADHESGRAAQGYTCNTELVGSYVSSELSATGTETFGSIAGFKVLRYTDANGNDCAYYDSTLMFPTNVVDVEGGVNVLDMNDPTSPVLTATLRTPAMLQPHESLVLSEERGILAAVMGTLSTAPGIIDLYDISADCRQPQLLSVTPLGLLGHESGLAPDGMTFYSASPSTKHLVAVDISDPLLPSVLWVGEYDSHGLTISEDGNRAYVAGTGTGLIILDTTEIQERVPNPTVPEIAILDWDTRSIPQNAIPFTRDGHPYVMEVDEFGTLSKVGAARIIDISDEANPFVVSDLRLEVHNPEHFDEVRDDPQAGLIIQGYAGHYCNIPTRVDPMIVACSFILSGLRVFDISDIDHPVEVAYFNAPVTDRPVFDALHPVLGPTGQGSFEASNWAMSYPSFVPERNEVWYSDGFQGFFAVRLTNDVWPQVAPSEAPAPAEPDDAVAASVEDLPSTGADHGIQTLGKLLLGLSLLLGGNARVRRRLT